MLKVGVRDAINQTFVEKINIMKIENPKQHITALLAEIEVLKSRLEPHDTGHLHTTINVLEERVKEILSSLWKKLK